MKKQDVRKMVDGISDTYIGEAVDRAMTGKLPEKKPTIDEILSQSTAPQEPLTKLPKRFTEEAADDKSEKKADTPIFLTKRAMIALTAVAAATVIAVGVIMRDAFPKEHITKPADTSSSETETSKPFAESSEGPYDPADENFMGGVGKLRPIGAKGIFGILVLRDDTRFYMNDGIYWQTGILPESMRGSDILIDEGFNPREQLYTLDTAVKYSANKIFTDDTAVYVQHDGALWQTDGYDETKLVTFSEVTGGDGTEKNFQTTSVRRVNDDVVYLFGGIGRETSAVIVVENGTGTRVTEGLDSDEPRTAHELSYSIADGRVFFLNGANTLTEIDYNDSKKMYFYNVNTDLFTSVMNNNKGWTVRDDALYFVSSKNTEVCRAALDRHERLEPVSVVGQVQEIFFADDCFYTVENTSGTDNIASDFADFATQLCSLCRYDYGSTEQQVVATQYNYAVNPAGQWIRPLIPLAAQDGFLLYRNADNYCVSVQTSGFSYSTYYSTEYSGARHSAVELASGWGGDHGSVVVKLWQNGETGTWFSPRFSLANSDGEPLPCNETEFPPTATYFPKTAGSQHYSFPAVGAAYLQCEWGEWYGELPSGDYILTVYTVDPDGTTELRHDLPFTVGEDGNCKEQMHIELTDVTDTRMADPLGVKSFLIENYSDDALNLTGEYKLAKGGEFVKPIGDHTVILHGTESDYQDSIAPIQTTGAFSIPARSNLSSDRYYIAIDWLGDYPKSLADGYYTLILYGSCGDEPVTVQTEVYLARPDNVDTPNEQTYTASVTETTRRYCEITLYNNNTTEPREYTGWFEMYDASGEPVPYLTDGESYVPKDIFPNLLEPNCSIPVTFNWEKIYGLLDPGDYTIRISYKDYKGDNITLPLHIEGSQNQIGSDKIDAYITAPVTQTGCTVVLKNNSDWQNVYYVEAYYIYSTDTGKLLLPGGEKSSFREIAYELPPGKERFLVLDWTDIYGALEPGNYALQIGVKDSSGKNLRLSLHID